LLTTFIRVNRFNEGYLVSTLDDGSVLDILRELKENLANLCLLRIRWARIADIIVFSLW